MCGNVLPEALSPLPPPITALQCDNQADGFTAAVSCGSYASTIISAVAFASYGTPSGACGNFVARSSCNSSTSIAVRAETTEVLRCFACLPV